MKWWWVSYLTLSLSSINWLMVKVMFNLNALPLVWSRTEKHLPVHICQMELKHNEELYNDILGYLCYIVAECHRDSHHVALYEYKKQMVVKYR